MATPPPPPDFWMGIKNLAAFSAPVRNPLQALALVPVPLLLFFFGVGILWTGLDTAIRVAMIAFAALLTLYILILIPWLIVKHPTSLFGESSQLRWQEMQLFGTNQHAISAVVVEQLPQVVAEPPPEPQPELPAGGNH
jgi:membrane protein implicated in regulation of membrane protease activity